MTTEWQPESTGSYDLRPALKAIDARLKDICPNDYHECLAGELIIYLEQIVQDCFNDGAKYTLKQFDSRTKFEIENRQTEIGEIQTFIDNRLNKQETTEAQADETT